MLYWCLIDCIVLTEPVHLRRRHVQRQLMMFCCSVLQQKVRKQIKKFKTFPHVSDLPKLVMSLHNKNRLLKVLKIMEK